MSDISLKLQIRQAKKEDLAVLFDLEKLCFKEDKFTKRQLQYLLLKARSLVLVASIEGNVVGSIIILLRNNIAHAKVYSLNVHPEYRQAGIASSLMDTASGYLKENGFREITLEVSINNEAARNLYISKGFSVDGILKNYYPRGDDALHMTRKL